VSRPRSRKWTMSGWISRCCRAYFNVPTDTDVLGDLKSVLEGLVTRA